MKYIYLASPYSHPSPLTREFRYDRITEIAGDYMAKGEAIYSPIVHGHTIAILSKDLALQGWDFWQKQCFPLLLQAKLLRIVKMKGWDTSEGIKAETAFATEHGIPIEYVEDPYEAT